MVSNPETVQAIIDSYERKQTQMMANATSNVFGRFGMAPQSERDHRDRALTAIRRAAEENWETFRHISREDFLKGWKDGTYQAAFPFDATEVMNRWQRHVYDIIAGLYTVFPILVVIALCIFARSIYYAPAAILPFIGSLRRLAVYPRRPQIELALLAPGGVWLVLTQGFHHFPSPLLVCIASYIWGSYCCLALERFEFAVKLSYSTQDDMTYTALGQHGLFVLRNLTEANAEP